MRKSPALLLTLVTVAAAALTACGSGSQTVTISAGAGSVAAAAAPATPSTAQAASTAEATTAATSTARRRSRKRPAHHGPAPGTLPQTAVQPSATTVAFRAEMTGLWSAVQRGLLAPAMPAFFPEAAYVQLKAIGDASGDWKGRLVGDYLLDIEAAHALLGKDAASAQLLGVHAIAGYGHWIPPGVCYNSVGYWEMPNARVVYRENGQVRSFGIASMISWRGVWYVVHLGAILRAGAGGEVDDPNLGPGVQAPSSTC